MNLAPDAAMCGWRNGLRVPTTRAGRPSNGR